jgi:hypothetical protein
MVLAEPGITGIRLVRRSTVPKAENAILPSEAIAGRQIAICRARLTGVEVLAHSVKHSVGSRVDDRGCIFAPVGSVLFVSASLNDQRGRGEV